MKPFVTCEEEHPSLDGICLDRKGHSGDHGYDEWPYGYGVGPPVPVRWPAAASSEPPPERESE